MDRMEQEQREKERIYRGEQARTGPGAGHISEVERDGQPMAGCAIAPGRSFSWAVDALKNGCRVRRTGWNGKGMFIFLVPGSVFEVNRQPMLSVFGPGTHIQYHAHIDMMTAQGYVVPWLASQADILDEDWEMA